MTVIGINIIATGRYVLFFDKLYKSIHKHFLPNTTKHFYVFTDNPSHFTPYQNCFVTPIVRKGYPGDTLFRFEYMLKIKDTISADYVYYLDVDSLVIDTVDETIIPEKPITMTSHPGFYNISNGTPESNTKSLAYIHPNERRNHYVAGGFFGGETKMFYKMAKEINDMIQTDVQNGIIPIHNDESMMNRWYVSNQDLVDIITPEYVYPECKYKFPTIRNYHSITNLTPRILALDKNHQWYRTI
jgi:hypothetical protein